VPCAASSPIACTAREGRDPAFGKGSRAYNRYQGDALHGPNPCIAPVERGPFYAIKLVIGDLGPYAGIKTDAHARALDAQGQVIPGLYAAGNDMASIMGGNYPGAGITLGPALTLGYRRKTSGTCDLRNPAISALAAAKAHMANAVKSPYLRWMVGRLGRISAVQNVKMPGILAPHGAGGRFRLAQRGTAP
jgi:hypothetical protein